MLLFGKEKKEEVVRELLDQEGTLSFCLHDGRIQKRHVVVFLTLCQQDKAIGNIITCFFLRLLLRMIT